MSLGSPATESLLTYLPPTPPELATGESGHPELTADGSGHQLATYGSDRPEVTANGSGCPKVASDGSDRPKLAVDGSGCPELATNGSAHLDLGEPPGVAAARAQGREKPAYCLRGRGCPTTATAPHRSMAPCHHRDGESARERGGRESQWERGRERASTGSDGVRGRRGRRGCGEGDSAREKRTDLWRRTVKEETLTSFIYIEDGYRATLGLLSLGLFGGGLYSVPTSKNRFTKVNSLRRPSLKINNFWKRLRNVDCLINILIETVFKTTSSVNRGLTEAVTLRRPPVKY